MRKGLVGCAREAPSVCADGAGTSSDSGRAATFWRNLGPRLGPFIESLFSGLLCQRVQDIAQGDRTGQHTGSSFGGGGVTRHHNRLDEWWGSAGDFDDANGLVDSRCSSPFSMSITAATIRTPDTPAAAPRSEVRRQRITATWASSGAAGVSHGPILVFLSGRKVMCP